MLSDTSEVRILMMEQQDIPNEEFLPPKFLFQLNFSASNTMAGFLGSFPRFSVLCEIIVKHKGVCQYPHIWIFFTCVA